MTLKDISERRVTLQGKISVLDLQVKNLDKTRAQMLANMQACDGGLQECDYWEKKLKDGQELRVLDPGDKIE